jgi:succinate dehydrogenase / fumarate reductase membrane anchor subunit
MPRRAQADLGRGRSGMFEWYLQRITGVALVVLLSLHFFVLHYATEGPVTYAKVMARLTSPAWKAIDLSFLVFAAYHAMNGFRTIIDDFVRGPALRSALVGALWLCSVGFVVLGAVTILTLEAKP